jgi:hypothetical protein
MFFTFGYIIEAYNTNISFVSSYQFISSVGQCDDQDNIPDNFYLLDNCLLYGNIGSASLYFNIAGYGRF